ncbi:AlkA N-terminal domain-containing protein [Cryobacterium mannosilyticum]|uniref:DNA-3-methyladenine glycosylase II n=1 Tax=Cryobacterium mannosilyticum TaxID=1259190 RepID=A0A4R8W6B6_9MICO|nr:AlkA N-terminal domain-containing protein [Cryobacterium mannosilyticum]TFC01453.1 DNA-3-methyladenine glycosylase 2 family protein [Cryobacterium mannosilyticum]
MSSRDSRFDGQFITGVHSTGIYCRPSCPAVTPKPSNVSFYLTSAAAHEAGLRACKRCLPDAVPGSPDWNIRDDLAARAMRLIADGAVEREGVNGLAARLGYSERHLTRVLVDELGAGPLALARAHRAQTARLLLGTGLPISEVAFAAGFGSIRQFNDTIAAVYERTPSELRSRMQAASRAGKANPHQADEKWARRNGAGQNDAGQSGAERAAAQRDEPAREPGIGTSVTLQLPARAPFDGPGVLGFLGVRAIPGVEAATADTYSRTLRLPNGFAAVELSLAGTPAAPLIGCVARLTSLADLAPLVSRVRRLLDLDADAQAIDLALAADPLLAASVAGTPGIRLPGSMDPEETLFRALLGQQVSVAAARTALSRLAEALGDPFPDAGAGQGLARLFPTAARIAADGRDVLRGPAARIDTVIRVAEALASGDLVLSYGQARETLESNLVALAGIGPWTAGYVAMRVLGSPDILLTSDLALRQGAARLSLPADPKRLAAAGAGWAPWRSYAGMHLWRAAGTPAFAPEPA